ncbi:hypothetical protein BSL78_05532 [Apostichopus japonicus]|uniref:Uncharacterized protein n=1 Tax=Stichopus japonicus TaxID=307972 RepID=A0A2G8LBC1_STIJA|nr:hypothetical protein BSL78_05532 [Apostichopus japonicus]
MSVAVNSHNQDPFRVPNSPTGELSQDDRSFEDDFLPVVPSPIPGPTTTKNMEHESLQSKAYLAHLEAKLKKIKGQSPSQKVNSRDMISSLCKVRIDANETLAGEDGAVSFDEPFEELKTVEVSDIKRRVLPEQALTLEN